MFDSQGSVIADFYVDTPNNRTYVISALINATKGGILGNFNVSEQVNASLVTVGKNRNFNISLSLSLSLSLSIYLSIYLPI